MRVALQRPESTCRGLGSESKKLCRPSASASAPPEEARHRRATLVSSASARAHTHRRSCSELSEEPPISSYDVVLNGGPEVLTGFDWLAVVAGVGGQCILQCSLITGSA